MPGVRRSVTVTSKQHESVSGMWEVTEYPSPLTDMGFAWDWCLQHSGALQGDEAHGILGCEQLQVETPPCAAGHGSWGTTRCSQACLQTHVYRSISARGSAECFRWRCWTSPTLSHPLWFVKVASAWILRRSRVKLMARHELNTWRSGFNKPCKITEGKKITLKEVQKS